MQEAWIRQIRSDTQEGAQTAGIDSQTELDVDTETVDAHVGG